MEQAKPAVKPLPMQECIVKALVRIAHAIDSKFDEQQDKIEKLEHRNMLIRRDINSMVNSRLQTRQAEIEATLNIFNECVETVKSEVALRKQDQFRAINSLQRKVPTQISSSEHEGQKEKELKSAALQSSYPDTQIKISVNDKKDGAANEPISEYILLDDFTTQRNKSALSSNFRNSQPLDQSRSFEKPQPFKVKLLNGDKLRILDLFI